MQPMPAYRPRPVRCLDVWEVDDWRLKVYGIAYDRGLPRSELVEAAKKIARSMLPHPADGDGRYGVGFVGAHDGRDACVAFVDWWANEDELHHHLYMAPSDRPGDLQAVGPTDFTACVWDLSVLAFEREAWLEAVLKNLEGPDLERYLKRRLSGDF